MKKIGKMCVAGLLFFMTLGQSWGWCDEPVSPQMARDHYLQGVAYGKQGKYDEAVNELEQAIAIDPAYAEAYNALAVVFHRQKHYQKAIEQYLLAIETEPAYTKARTNLALVYYEQEEYRKALMQLKRALESEPEYAPARSLLEKVKKQAADQDNVKIEERDSSRASSPQAVSESEERVPKSSGENAESLFHAGTALMKQGSVDDAILAYRKGLELVPRSAVGHTLLGMAYREKGRITRDDTWKEREMSAFSTALRSDPAYVPALLSLGEWYYEQGQVSKAIPYFQAVLRSQPTHPAREQLTAIIKSGQ